MLREYAFHTVDAFTQVRFGGNPLAVFPDARGLDTATMQSLAAEMNYSEATFVFPPVNPANTAQARIFNRTAELPFAGHPNVGTANFLSRLASQPDPSFDLRNWPASSRSVLRAEAIARSTRLGCYSVSESCRSRRSPRASHRQECDPYPCPHARLGRA